MSIGVLVVLAAGIAAMGAAGAPSSIKTYTAAIVQESETGYKFTLTNDPTSTQSFGAARIDVPLGFSISSASVTAPPGKTWTISPPGSVLELKAANSKSGIAPGELLAVTFTATAPCSGATYLWNSDVRQANNFNGPRNEFGGNSPTLAVIGPPATFEIAEITSPQVVGVAFGVEATAKDACGNVASFYTGTPTLSGLRAASNGTQPTYTPLSFANSGGVAAASATPVRSQFGAQLTASDGTASGTSNSFDVVDRLCKPSDASCEASHPDGTRVTAPVPPAGAATKLALSGPGNSFACEGTTYPNIGSHVTVDPDYPEGETAPIEIAIEWSLASAPSGSRVICMTKNGVTFVVQKCGKTPVAPCELTRSRTGDILRATFLIAPADPGWSLG